MKTILIVLRDEISPYNSSFKLARELQQRGYRIIYTCSSKMENYICKMGFESQVFGFTNVRTEFTRFISKNPIDLALIEPTMFDYAPFLLIQKIPMVGLNAANLASVCSSKVTPVFSYRLFSKNQIINQVINLSLWGYLFLKMAIKHRSQLFNYKALNFFRELGYEVKWGEYGYRLKIPELTLTPRGFDFPIISDWTERIYIGASLSLQRMSVPFNWNILQKNKLKVYCSLGSHGHSYKNRMKLLRAIVRAVSEQSEWQLILQLNNDDDREQLEEIACENVVILKWVPQFELLSKVDVFITHGGLSSVRESVYNETPMIVFPFHADQYGNSARIVYHNLGVRAKPTFVNVNKVKKLIYTIVKDIKIQSAIKKMKKVFEEEENVNLGIDVIERVLNDKYKIKV